MKVRYKLYTYTAVAVRAEHQYHVRLQYYYIDGAVKSAWRGVGMGT